MRKALRIIALTTGIISVLSAVVLGCIYLEDMLGYVKKIKAKLSSRSKRNALEEEYEADFAE